MKLSVWSSYYIDLSPEAAILELKKHGIDYVELSDEHAAMLLGRGNPKEVGKAFGEYAKSIGMNIEQGHLWLKVKICSDDNAIRILGDWFELFEAIGIKNAVLHCDPISAKPELSKEDWLNENIRVIKLLAEKLEGKNLRICLENLRIICGTSKDLLKIVEGVGSDSVGICLDTGHLNLSKEVMETQRDFILNAKDRLWALHLNDNEGETDQHLMSFCRGNVDFKEIFAALKEIGFNGIYNFEIPGENKAPLEIRGYKLDFVKKAFQYMEENY